MKVIWEKNPRYNWPLECDQLIAASDSLINAAILDHKDRSLTIIVYSGYDGFDEKAVHGIRIDGVRSSTLGCFSPYNEVIDVYVYDEHVFSNAKSDEYNKLLEMSYVLHSDELVEESAPRKIFELVTRTSTEKYGGSVLCSEVTWIENLTKDDFASLVSNACRIS